MKAQQARVNAVNLVQPNWTSEPVGFIAEFIAWFQEFLQLRPEVFEKLGLQMRPTFQTHILHETD